MILKVFAIRDDKAEAFMQPWCAPNRGIALRSFADAANDGQSNVSKYPNDHGLFEIGEYDDSTGIIIPLSTGPSFVSLAADYVEKVA